MAMMSPTDAWSIALAPFAGWPDATAQKHRDSALKSLATRFLAWRAQRATLQALRRVDGATLRDLGILDIESTVYGAPDGHTRNYDPDWWRRAR